MKVPSILMKKTVYTKQHWDTVGLQSEESPRIKKTQSSIAKMVRKRLRAQGNSVYLQSSHWAETRGSPDR